MLRVIVGLGNPKPEYQLTRHNVGRDFIDFLAQENNSRFVKKRQAEELDLPFFSGPILKLNCFMNESGVALKNSIDMAIPASDILVVVDDFMIPFGTLRLRPGGSSGGHNGLKSIIEQFGTDQFPRLRIGVGPVPDSEDPANFVLEKFTKSERIDLPKIFAAINEGISSIINKDLPSTMNVINKNHLA